MMYAPLIIILFLFCSFARTNQNVGNGSPRLRSGQSANNNNEIVGVASLNLDDIEVSSRFIVYLLDSGVRATHSLLANVTVEHAFAIEEATINETESKDTDRIPGHGHGTFTASIIAKAASYADITIVPLVVVNSTGFGHPTSILKAVQFAKGHHKQNHPNEHAIIVMPVAERKVVGWFGYLADWLGTHVHSSLGSPTEQAWKLADEAGIFIIAAAGNWQTNNCAQFMNDFLSLFIVGARTDDSRAHYSNFGPCVSLFANGKAVGASGFGDDETTTFLGTSVSAPLVAQAVIRYWTMAEQTTKTRLTAHEVYQRIMQDKTVIDDEYITDLACSDAQPEMQSACQRTVRKALIDG